MVGYLPREVREGLDLARRRADRQNRRLRLEVGGQSFVILRYWDKGFALASTQAPLRGLADLYDGGRHLAQCLIVASSDEGAETVYEVKRQTIASDAPPADFVRERPLPAGLLPDLS